MKSTHILEFNLMHLLNMGKDKLIEKIEKSDYIRSNRYE